MSSPRTSATLAVALARVLVGTAVGVGVALTSACAHRDAESDVVEGLAEREGASVDLEREPDQAPTLPEGVELGDGLGRDEAVAIALWSSPALRSELTRAEAAEGQLAGAKRPTNPTLRLLFPLTGGATFAGLLTWPLESLATMPGRIALARSQLAGTEVALIQTGLDLARDVRLAHADWVLAHERVELRETMAAQAAELLAIVTAQSEFGDVSELDSETARAAAATAADELDRARADLRVAELQLRTRLGWGLDDAPLTGPLTVQAEPLAALPGVPLAELEGASASRPEVELAQIEVDRAKLQLRLERAAIVSVAAVGQATGPALQLGPQLAVPIFDQNQTGRARARAELEAAKWRQRGLRERIVAEVREAYLRFEQASASHHRYEAEIVESRARALAAATESYQLGEHDFGPVLLAADQLALARLRAVELEADLRRAHAQLERALGGRLSEGLAAREAQKNGEGESNGGS